MDIFGLDLQNFLDKKRIFIVEIVDNKLKVIFSTSVNNKNFVSFGNYLRTNKTEGNDFFEVLNYNTFASMNSSLDYINLNKSKLSGMNCTDIKSKANVSLYEYNREELNYISFCNNFFDIYQNYMNNILPNITEVIMNITNHQIQSKDLYLNELPGWYIYNNDTKNIEYSRNLMQIFTLPIKLSFDYIDDYNIIKTNNTKIFFLFVQNPDSVQIIDAFYMNIIYSMIFSFISVCFLNFVIWVIIGSCYYLYFKAILSPLKRINKEFKDLVFIKEKNLNTIRKYKKSESEQEKDKQIKFLKIIKSKN